MVCWKDSRPAVAALSENWMVWRARYPGPWVRPRAGLHRFDRRPQMPSAAWSCLSRRESLSRRPRRRHRVPGSANPSTAVRHPDHLKHPALREFPTTIGRNQYFFVAVNKMRQETTCNTLCKAHCLFKWWGRFRWNINKFNKLNQLICDRLSKPG